MGRGTNTNTQVIGTEPVYPAVRNLQIAEGSFVTAEQVTSAARVAVLGPTARDDLFGSPDTGGTDPIGQTVRIKNVDFKVIGVTVAKGGSGFTNPDDSIYVPLTTAERFLAGATYLTTISVQAQSANDMTTLQQEITDLLLQRHKITDPTLADFSVINQADIVATASSVTNTFTLLLAAIAGISLVVGGIGIMNMMLTTVTERTREIGLRKAIGARKWDISIQFLTEAVMLTFISGGIGIVGWLGRCARPLAFREHQGPGLVDLGDPCLRRLDRHRHHLRLLSGAQGRGTQSHPGSALRVTIGNLQSTPTTTSSNTRVRRKDP